MDSSSERMSGHISTIKEDNLEFDDDFDKPVSATQHLQTDLDEALTSQASAETAMTSHLSSDEAMLTGRAYPSFDDYGHQHIAGSSLDIINEQTEQTYAGEQYDNDTYEQQQQQQEQQFPQYSQPQQDLLNMRQISTDFNNEYNSGLILIEEKDRSEENELSYGDNNKDLLESDSISPNTGNDNLVDSNIIGTDMDSDINRDRRQYNYELNDPFKTPEHAVSDMHEIIETTNEDQYISSMSVPYETVSTNFGSELIIEDNKADESSFNLLDLDSSQQYISNEMQQKIDDSVEDAYHSDGSDHSDHSRNSDDDSQSQVVTSSENTLTAMTSHLQSANSDAEHILISSGGIAAKPPNLEHLLINDNDDSLSQNYCVDYKHTTDLLQQKQTENIERFDNTMENIDVIATSTSSGDSSSQCPFNPLAELVYWRDPRKSGIVFGIGLILLVSLAYFSIISVLAYASLAALSVTLSFRIYKNILQAVQKTSDGHPFKEYLEAEITPSNERVHQIVDTLLNNYNYTINKLRAVFLVEDIIDSLKFVILFWCLTYIGSWFNGLTLVILAYLAAFSLPKVYEMNKTNIDLYLQLACTQINEITSKIRAKVPFPSRKEKDN